MPYWVEQAKGDHKAAIDKVRDQYRKGILTTEQAWAKMSTLYRHCRPDREPPALADHIDRPEHCAYMLLTWFPLYANMWFEGSPSECRTYVRMVSRPGITYKVVYEY